MNKTKRTEAEQKELLAYIRERYVYEPESGMIRHKKHDKPPKPHRTTTSNYCQVLIRWKGKRFPISIHHAVWVVCKGRWPEKPLDHINGDEKDNRIENLRECSQGENNLNMEHPWVPSPSAGVPGVEKTGTKYRTKVRGKRMCFSSPYEAFFHATMCGKRYRQRQETTLGIFSTMNHKNL